MNKIFKFVIVIVVLVVGYFLLFSNKAKLEGTDANNDGIDDQTGKALDPEGNIVETTGGSQSNANSPLCYNRAAWNAPFKMPNQMGLNLTVEQLTKEGWTMEEISAGMAFLKGMNVEIFSSRFTDYKKDILTFKKAPPKPLKRNADLYAELAGQVFEPGELVCKAPTTEGGTTTGTGGGSGTGGGYSNDAIMLYNPFRG